MNAFIADGGFSGCAVLLGWQCLSTRWLQHLPVIACSLPPAVVGLNYVPCLQKYKPSL